MRVRHQQESIKLNYGSLYSVIAGLEKRGLIEARETVRHGRRPERTVYSITAAGRREAVDWLAELLARPVKEYLQFEAALSLVAALPPEEVAELLRQRLGVLEVQLAVTDAQLAARTTIDLPRLFVLETEYQRRLVQAERDFVAELLAELDSGTFERIDEWRTLADELHADGPTSPPTDDR
jgi:DNA-binding PadR family transcriptional regulator